MGLLSWLRGEPSKYDRDYYYNSSYQKVREQLGQTARCASCGGTGRKTYGGPYETCRNCGGSGRVDH